MPDLRPLRALGCAVLLVCAATLVDAQDKPKPQDPPKKEAKEDGKPQDEPTKQEDVVITERAVQATPHAQETSTVNKGEVPFLENTRRVDVITPRMIRDQGATTAPELWRFIPNAIPGERGVVTVRGFDIGQSALSGGQLYDGVRASVYNLIPANLYNVDRIEMLKGPGGVMYGSGQPGAVVNHVLKKPLVDPYLELNANFDSFGKKRIGMDVSGPLSEEDHLYYRLNVSGEDSDTFRKNENFQNMYAAPAFSFRPTEDTTINVLGEVFQDRRSARGYGVPIFKGSFFKLPRDYSINDPDEFREVEAFVGQIQVGQRITRDVRIDFTGFGGRSYYRNEYHEGMRNAAEDAANNPVYRRQWRDQFSDTKLFGYDWHLTYELQTGSISHRFLLGNDFTQITDPQFPAIDQKITNPLSGTNPDGAQPVDLGNPNAPAPSRANYGVDSSSETHAHEQSIGGYFNYRIGFAETLFLNAGIRYDHYNETTDTVDRLTNVVTKTDQTTGDPQYEAGFVWKFLPTMSTFYSYSDGFHPQGWTTVNNANGPFPALTWNQHEGGFLMETLDRKVGAQISVFQITRNHDLVPDTTPGAPVGAQIDIGKTRSRGVEASVSGRFDSKTSLILAYGYTDAYVLKTTSRNVANTDTLQGQRLAGIPHHTASITLTQDMERYPVRFFLGMTYLDTRPARLDDTDPLQVTIPGYTIFDGGVTYLGKSWEARLGVNNIFDKDYTTIYRSPAHAVNHGEPRTFTLSLAFWF